MHFLILGLLIVGVVFGPQLWARYTLRRYSQPQPDLPGTGGELARHLLDKFDLQDVQVEITNRGDHYDPISRTVRMTPEYFDGKSLTAVAIAAHEVGHAIQHAQNHPMLNLRTRLVQTAAIAEKVGSIAMLTIPIITAVTRAPSAGLFMFAIGILSILVSTIVHLVTLPVEWDASFGKALPVLKAGKYISDKEYVAAKSVLRAAALTYVASSLASLLNLWRWIAVFRR